MCLAQGGVGGLCLGFTNPVETGGVLDVCLCFGCVGGTNIAQGSGVMSV